MMSGITRDMSLILWISAGIAAVNFFASFVGMALIGIGFQLSESNSPLVDTNITTSGECSQYLSCYDCTDEYDKSVNGGDLNCGFCYMPGDDGVSAGSCVPWTLDDDDIPVADNGRCSIGQDRAEDFIFVAQYCPTNYGALILVGLMMYLVSFQAGVGPVPWVYNPEIYPLWFRSTGVSISTGFNWCLNIIVTFTFTYFIQYLGFGTFYLYGGFSLLAIFWFFLVLPESKGKSLEEMEDVFSKPLWKLGRQS